MTLKYTVLSSTLTERFKNKLPYDKEIINDKYTWSKGKLLDVRKDSEFYPKAIKYFEDSNMNLISEHNQDVVMIGLASDGAISRLLKKKDIDDRLTRYNQGKAYLTEKLSSRIKFQNPQCISGMTDDYIKYIRENAKMLITLAFGHYDLKKDYTIQLKWLIARPDITNYDIEHELVACISDDTDETILRLEGLK